VRIIHIADVHWRGLSRHEEYIIAFKKFYKQAKDLNPDVLYIGGDIVHSKTQGISPELIQSLCWWFTKMADICPVHVILGNHDGLMLNKDRQDAITPIVNALDNPNIYLYKDSGVYDVGFDGFKWCVFSCFDEENWDKVKPVDGCINLALYHGSVRGSLTDTDWQLEGEIKLDFFDGYQFVLLGDIHKRQFLNKEKTAAYCGSTIQQNYGEDPEKGFLLWDIKDENDFEVEFHAIEPVYPFVTVEWQGSTSLTLKQCQQYPRQSRFRIKADSFISQSDAKRLQKHLKKSLNAKEVVYKVDAKFESENVFDSESEEKLNLRSSEVHKTLLRNYYKNQDLAAEEWDSLDDLTEKYVSEITDVNSDRRHVKWTLNNIKFSNLFSYGEGNIVNFDNLNGITGIFGRNARGKSSIVGAIAYNLFNTTDRGAIKNIHVINNRKNSCKASSDITINGKPYRVVRETIKKQTKKNIWAPTSLKLYRLDVAGEILEDITEEQRRETEKILRGLIGTSDEFLMTSLASQGEMNTFIKEKATSRKTILSNFLDLTVFDKMYDTSRRDSQDLRTRAATLGSENWELKINQCQIKIDEYLSEKAKIENNIEDNKNQLSIFQKELHSSGLTDIVAESDITKEKNVLIQVQKSIDKKSQDLAECESKIRDDDLTVEKINNFLSDFDIDEVKKKKQAKKNISRNLLELQGVLNLERNELENIRKLAKKLEPCDCFEHLPSCKYIKKSSENKQKMDNQEEKVTFLSVKVDDINNELEKLSDDYDSKIDKYAKIIQKKSALVTAMTENKVKIERLTQTLIKLRDQETQHTKNLNQLEEKFRLQNKENITSSVKDKIYDIENNLKTLDKDRNRLINNLATWRANKKLYTKQQNEYREVNGKLRVYELFTQAVSKRGIPVQIIHSLLPKINAETTKILQGVVGFSVELQADLDSNAMDIYINYGDSRRIVELGSGMEKMMASLAIRVALINISSLPKTNMLVIDEGFGALDETNLESCGKLLKSLKKYFKNILVISHIDEIKDIVDNTIEITKNGVDSNVYQS